MLQNLKNYTILVITALNFGCYEDKADKPSAIFEVLTIDSLDSEKLADTVFLFEDVKFVNRGSGEYFVVWTDEKRVSFSGVEFQLTSASWEQMAQQLVPEEIIDQVRSLEGEIFSSESKFSQAIFNAIGSDLAIFDKYEYQIKSSGYSPFKSIDGKDSTRFSYNHDYDDFQVRTEKGFYNVTGIPLSVDNNSDFSVIYNYRLPGRYKVTFAALGVSDFGATTISSLAEKEIIVIAR